MEKYTIELAKEPVQNIYKLLCVLSDFTFIDYEWAEQPTCEESEREILERLSDNICAIIDIGAKTVEFREKSLNPKTFTVGTIKWEGMEKILEEHKFQKVRLVCLTPFELNQKELLTLFDKMGKYFDMKDIKETWIDELTVGREFLTVDLQDGDWWFENINQGWHVNPETLLEILQIRKGE